MPVCCCWAAREWAPSEVVEEMEVVETVLGMLPVEAEVILVDGTPIEEAEVAAAARGG